MGFNTETDVHQVISKKHQAMLQTLSKKHGKFMRRIIEDLIEKEYAKR